MVKLSEISIELEVFLNSPMCVKLLLGIVLKSA